MRANEYMITTAIAAMALIASSVSAQTIIGSPNSPVDSTNSNNQSPIQTNAITNSAGLSSADANGNISTNTNVAAGGNVGPVTNTNGMATNNADNRNTVSNNTIGGNASTTSGPATTVSGPANTTSGAATTNSGAIDNRSSATGGSVLASGNSTNAINTTDVNTNAQGQQQGQQQANLQGQQQGILGSGNSSSRSGVTGSGNSNVDVAGNNSQLTNNAGDVNVQVDGDTINYQAAKIPVSSAYAAPSVVGGGVCAYTPFSAGVQFLKFGGSAQGAIIDEGCEDRANADVLARLGLRQEAVVLLSNNPRVAAAVRTVAEANAKSQHSANTWQEPVAEKAKAEAPTQAVQDQAVGAVVAQGFIDPKKGYRILRADAQPE